MTKKKKIAVYSVVTLLVVFLTATMGGSFYMLDYSLSPDPNRADTAFYFSEQFKTYPETRHWVDSLRGIAALRDTFVTMPDGTKQHAYYVRRGGNKTAVVVHGWRDCAIEFLYLGRLYEHELGYNVVMPDLHASGLSEGDAVQMGWFDKDDVLQWLTIFRTDTMVVHGVSMGGATTMMLSAEKMPEGIKDLHFINDCGYTSVWDEFCGELKNQFNLPAFPIMYSTSMLCKLRYGWSFGEASALEAVKKTPYPMLFIHGDADTFVPTEMVYRLYEAKPSDKELWITKGAEHAVSYLTHRDEYIERVSHFLRDN